MLICHKLSFRSYRKGFYAPLCRSARGKRPNRETDRAPKSCLAAADGSQQRFPLHSPLTLLAKGTRGQDLSPRRISATRELQAAPLPVPKRLDTEAGSDMLGSFRGRGPDFAFSYQLSNATCEGLPPAVTEEDAWSGKTMQNCLPC